MGEITERRRFLYGASVLMGHAAFPRVLAAFQGGGGRPFTPALARPRGLLSEPEMRTLTALVDVILPATDSPAASAAETHEFIDLALAACASATAQATLRKGLADLAARGFLAMAPEKRAELLAERARSDMPLPYDQSFFKILKDYTLTGYFHSEKGATQALAYDKVPGGYEGDLPLRPGQKAWAL
jgi:hypothetical protein